MPMDRILHPEPRGSIHPFNYSRVQLGPSRWRDQYRQTRDYYLAIPNDDMLKGFRQRAGLAAPGEDLGGWYSGNDRGQTYSLGDHFNVFGQWLSAFARMARVADDGPMRAKAVSLMREWARTIEPDGYFFFSRHCNAPHYFYDKMVGGLVDIAGLLGEEEAVEHLETITHWAVKNLDRSRTSASYEDWIGEGPLKQSEWYTLSENLYRAHELTGDGRYREFAQVWHYTSFWGGLAEGEDELIHKHAFSHVNSLGGAAAAFAVTGERKYFDAIDNAFRFLRDYHSYATGGYGPEERFRPHGSCLGEWLDPDIYEYPGFTFETPCGSWAAFKLVRYLMGFTGAAYYGDWAECLLYNGIGAALPMAGRGKTFYESSYMMEHASKFYDTARWPCCSGTYPLAVADYHDLIYFEDEEGIYVNLFLPSELSWSRQGQPLRIVQETAFPASQSSRITIHARRPVEFRLRIRVPGWLAGDMRLTVNGERVPFEVMLGRWALLERIWRDGDTVDIDLPARLCFAAVDQQHPRRAALTLGPVVLVASQGPVIVGDQSDPESWIVPAERPLTFRVESEALGRTFKPFYELGERAPYHMYLDIE